MFNNFSNVQKINSNIRNVCRPTEPLQNYALFKLQYWIPILLILAKKQTNQVSSQG